MQKKVNVTALLPFSHGNVDARQGGTYAMNAGDAKELEKNGFVSLAGEGATPEHTQIDQPRQVKNQGDVVVDDTDEDVLGEKMAGTPENKMAPASANKTAKK